MVPENKKADVFCKQCKEFFILFKPIQDPALPSFHLFSALRCAGLPRLRQHRLERAGLMLGLFKGVGLYSPLKRFTWWFRMLKIDRGASKITARWE